MKKNFKIFTVIITVLILLFLFNQCGASKPKCEATYKYKEMHTPEVIAKRKRCAGGCYCFFYFSWLLEGSRYCLRNIVIFGNDKGLKNEGKIEKINDDEGFRRPEGFI